MPFKTAPTGLALAFLLNSSVAFSQEISNFGQLVAKGGQKLTKEEISILVSGTKLLGQSTANPDFKTESLLKSDGTMAGHATPYVGRGGATYAGTWQVNDQGQICSEVRVAGGSASKRCDFMYKLGSSYFLVATENPSDKIYERQITK